MNTQPASPQRTTLSHPSTERWPPQDSGALVGGTWTGSRATGAGPGVCLSSGGEHGPLDLTDFMGKGKVGAGLGWGAQDQAALSPDMPSNVTWHEPPDSHLDPGTSAPREPRQKGKGSLAPGCLAFLC